MARKMNLKNTNFHLIYNIDSYTNDKHSEALLNPDRWAEGYSTIYWIVMMDNTLGQ